MAEGTSGKKIIAVSKNPSRVNSATPTLSDRNVKREEGENNENESIADTIEDYSDEGYDDEDEELDENSKERRVRFKVGSL